MKNKTTKSENNNTQALNNGIPVSPSFRQSFRNVLLPEHMKTITGRSIFISVLCVLIALISGFMAQVLISLINLFTNISFYHRISFAYASPSHTVIGYGVLFVPIIGGCIVGLMARYGSKGIRGHGIPEAMENILINESRIPARLTFLKPVSAAVAIGTGGPFGAEGPIIATGGALGSLVGQVLQTTANERKILLAAGAAAGMAATFGTPVSAVILAIELLLFEFHPRSVIPVALAATTATAVRIFLVGNDPVFAMHNLQQPGGFALATYVILGAVIGSASVFVTRAVYFIEDMFEKLPLHWMWWPMLGGIAIGITGYFVPQTLGVGYDNIENILNGSIVFQSLLLLCIMKFISWSISLGSGTSGGTLAPLFTIGGALGGVLGILIAVAFPWIGVDPRLAALVGMASLFTGASRALLASVVFAFETTLQPIGLLPLLGGCTASYFVSSLLMKNSIMTEKIERRGVRVPREYTADYLDQIRVTEVTTKHVVTLQEAQTVSSVQQWFESGAPGSGHQGFPVIDEHRHLLGVLTRRNIFEHEGSGDLSIGSLLNRPPVAVYDDCSLREAVDHMVRHSVGRLPVISRTQPFAIVGIISRSDILTAYHRRLKEHSVSASGFLSKIFLRYRNSSPVS